MPPRTNRLERITNLLLALLDTPRPLSLREIGRSVGGYPAEPGALRQAFERDKRTLRDEGIPITTERIDGDDQVGYRILPEQYYLPDLGLESDEQDALAFALTAVRLDAGVSKDVGAKLGTVAESELPPVVVLPTLPGLGPLQEAIRTRSIVHFDYHDRQRTLAGCGLAFKEGCWYFLACLFDEPTTPTEETPSADLSKLRTFRVDRIAGALILGDPGAYVVPKEFDPASVLRFSPFNRSGDDTEVVVDVDVRDGRRALSTVGPSALIDGAPQGSVRLRFHIGDHEAFLSWIFGLGDSVEVIAPSAIRQEVIDRLHRILDADQAWSKAPS